MICNCPFFERISWTERELLVEGVDGAANNCALAANAVAPCRMVLLKHEPDWDACPLSRDDGPSKGEVAMYARQMMNWGVTHYSGDFTVLAFMEEDKRQLGEVINPPGLKQHFRLRLELTRKQFIRDRIGHMRKKVAGKIEGFIHQGKTVESPEGLVDPGPEYTQFWRADLVKPGERTQ